VSFVRAQTRVRILGLLLVVWPSAREDSTRLFHVLSEAAKGAGMTDASHKLAEQVKKAEKTLLALEALLSQTTQMINATRQIIDEAKGVQSSNGGSSKSSLAKQRKSRK
jgi:hypothetical protein